MNIRTEPRTLESEKRGSYVTVATWIWTSFLLAPVAGGLNVFGHFI